MAGAAGVPKRQEVMARRVASVPQDEFEALAERDDPLTVTALAELGTEREPAPAGFELATMLISAIDQFAAAFRLDNTDTGRRQARARFQAYAQRVQKNFAGLDQRSHAAD